MATWTNTTETAAGTWTNVAAKDQIAVGQSIGLLLALTSAELVEVNAWTNTTATSTPTWTNITAN